MKQRILILTFIVATGLLTLTSNKSGVSGNSTAGCSCHNPNASTSVAVALSGLSGSYAPGYTYTCTLTVSHASLAAAGIDLKASAGTLTAGSTTRILNGDITHIAPLVMSSGSANFVFNWTAPASGTGDVTFSFVGNAVNGDNSAGSPDVWNTGTLKVSESPTAITDVKKSTLKMYPNPAVNYINIDTDKELENITLLSISGQAMKFKAEKISTGYHLDFESMLPGVYFVRYQIGENTYSQPFQVR